MAVMTQVHVSRVRFHHYSKELATADEYLSVQGRLISLMRQEEGGKLVCSNEDAAFELTLCA